MNSFQCSQLLDRDIDRANIGTMAHELSNLSISLEQAFGVEEKALKRIYSENDLTTAQIVTEARRALDRAGVSFSNSTNDPMLQRTGLWLIEIIKSGTSILDQAVGSDIVWHEVAKPSKKGWTSLSFFYAVGAALAVYGFFEQNRLLIYSVAILSIIRLFDAPSFQRVRQNLPFFKGSARLTQDNRSVKAEARIITRTQGFITSIRESLKTADHILMRLAEPDVETHWKDDQRLMGLVQGLLEAKVANDGDFALKLIGHELDSVLAGEGIRQISYSSKTADLFDVLPAPGVEEPKLAAPALISDDQVIKRGTVWSQNG